MNKFQRLGQYLLIFTVCMGLSACGFHLRGGDSLPPQLHKMHIDAAPYAPLTLDLKESLRSAGVTLVKSEKQSPITLQIITENFSQHIVDISANTFVKTYRLYYIVSYQLLNQEGKVLFGPSNIKVSSTYVANDNQILGDNTQLSTEKTNLRRELIGLLFLRLGSSNVRNALTSR